MALAAEEPRPDLLPLAVAADGSRARRLLGLARREAEVGLALTAGFLVFAVAVAALAGDHATVSPWLLMTLVVVVAALSTVELEIGPGIAVPTMLGVIPMLVLLPAWCVPLALAGATLLGALADVLVHRRAHVARALLPIGGCWYAAGPVLVVLASGHDALPADDWSLLAAVVATHLLGDALTVIGGERAAQGSSLRSLLRPIVSCMSVDLLLAPLGYVIGVATLDRGTAVGALVPAVVLTWLVARERRGGIDAAITATQLTTEREDARANARDLSAILAWTRQSASVPSEAATAVCWAATVVLEARSAILVERQPAGWRVRAATAGQSDAILSDVPEPRAARVAPLPAETVPADLAAMLGPDVASVLVWSLPGRQAEPPAALVVGWTDDVEEVAERRCVALDVLAAEGRGALEREATLTRLDDLARRDPLTGVANRRSWDEELPRAVAHAAGGHEQLCVALVDLDHFKAYNDQRGHAAGDRLLREAAAAWHDVLRSGDLLARYGGEEFALLLPRCAMREAVAVLERLRAATPERITCSIGVAAWDGQEPASTLLDRADGALYEAKRAGRDRLTVAA